MRAAVDFADKVLYSCGVLRNGKTTCSTLPLCLCAIGSLSYRASGSAVITRRHVSIATIANHVCSCVQVLSKLWRAKP